MSQLKIKQKAGYDRAQAWIVLMCVQVTGGLALPGVVCPACLLWKKISLTCTGHPAEVYYVCVACVQ